MPGRDGTGGEPGSIDPDRLGWWLGWYCGKTSLGGWGGAGCWIGGGVDMDDCRDGVGVGPGGLAYTGGWREKTSIILMIKVCSCLSCHHSCATVILPPGSTSRPLRTPMSLVGTTKAIGGACGYSCGSHMATGIWYVLPLYGVGSVPWSCSSSDV